MDVERDGMNKLLQVGLVDAYRHVNPLKEEYTSWYSWDRRKIDGW
jgi:exonuclease III